MTDSLKITLDLSKVQKEHLQQIPIPHVFRAERGETGPTILFAAKQTWKSPLTLNNMMIKVRVNQFGVPVALNAEINIPNATVGQNAELGHSVPAALFTSLCLFKIFLGSHGVPKESIDLLSLKDVRLQNVTITYLVPKHEKLTAQECIEIIGKRLTLFFPLSDDHRYGGSTVGSSGSKTAYLKMRGWGLRVYSTPPNKIPDGIDVEVRKNRISFAQKTIRIELTLTSELLSKLGLQYVEAWEFAHDQGTYKTLFDVYIRNKSLRLNERLRQDKPDASDLMKLSATNKHIVEGYLEAKPLINCRVLNKPSKIASQKARSAARIKILEQLRIDIDIDWIEHRNLGTGWMDKIIVYPGDYHPPADHIADSFCRDNFQSIKKQLETVLNDTIQGKSPR